MPIAITLELAGIEEFQKDIAQGAQNIKKEMSDAMSKSVNTVKNKAQLLAPFKTGTLRRSIFTDVQNSGLQGIVSQDSSIASYGADIEYGTRAHIIMPVNKKALFWKGALNPYKRVMHPGTQAQPFMVPAIEQSVEAIQQFFNEAMQNVIDTISGKK